MLTLHIADVMLPELENVKADYRQDSLPVCAGLYEAFLVKGATGRDALLCYLHLLWTYRRQGTNRPWAVSKYLENGLDLSPKRVRIAKGLLHSMKLIEYVRDRTKSGRLGKVYTKLNLVSNPFATGAMTALVGESPEIATGAVSPCVAPVRQMLEERNVNASALNTTLAAKRKDGKPKGEHSQFVASFFDLHKEYRHVAPKWGVQEGSLLKADLKRLGLADLSGLARTFFADPPPDVAKWAGKAGWGYVTLHGQIDKLLADRRQTLDSLPERTCPECGKKQTHTGQECFSCHASLKGNADALRHAS